MEPWKLSKCASEFPKKQKQKKTKAQTYFVVLVICMCAFFLNCQCKIRPRIIDWERLIIIIISVIMTLWKVL